MAQAQHVAGTRISRQQRLNRKLHSAIAEVAQKRVARSQWKESERRFISFVRGKEPVDNLVRSPIAAHRDKFSVASGIGLANYPSGLAGSAGFNYVQFNPARPQTFESRSNQFAASPSARRRIDHGKKGAVHAWSLISSVYNSTTAARLNPLRISSASNI